MDKVNDVVAKLEEMGNGVPQIVELSKKTGVRVGHICLGAAVIIPLLILIFFGATIVAVAVTVLYPGFKSIEALETKDDDEDDKKWLSYWIIFGLITLADQFFWFILEWIPYYTWVRFALFVFLFAPQTNGSMVIYKSVLKPILEKNQDRIEAFIEDVKGAGSSIAKEAIDNAKE
jgi:receptor expression-enhancing protein 5/6